MVLKVKKVKMHHVRVLKNINVKRGLKAMVLTTGTVIIQLP
jgi:hypothetical protein